jgi:hypothetical protein
VYHGVGDAVTLCARWGGILSKNVEKLGRFHWNADGGSDLDGVIFVCIAFLVVVHVVWMVAGGYFVKYLYYPKKAAATTREWLISSRTKDNDSNKRQKGRRQQKSSKY